MRRTTRGESNLLEAKGVASRGSCKANLAIQEPKESKLHGNVSRAAGHLIEICSIQTRVWRGKKSVPPAGSLLDLDNSLSVGLRLYRRNRTPRKTLSESTRAAPAMQMNRRGRKGSDLLFSLTRATVSNLLQRGHRNLDALGYR